MCTRAYILVILFHPTFEFHCAYVKMTEGKNGLSPSMISDDVTRDNVSVLMRESLTIGNLSFFRIIHAFLCPLH